MKHICVCYEERGPFERVIERTAELAKLSGARVTVVSVTPTPVRFGRGIGPYDPADPPVRHELEVTKAIAHLERLGVKKVAGEALTGDPADEIVAHARRLGADLIVLGAHEGGFVSSLVEGRIDDAISHHSPIDVLIVH